MQNSVINPAVSDAQKIDARINRGSSNPNRTVEAVAKGAAPTLAGIGKVAESTTASSRLDDEIKRSLGLVPTTQQAALSNSTQQLNPIKTSDPVAASSAVTAAGANTPGPNLALAQGLAGVGNTIQAVQQNQQAQADRDRLFSIFERTVGNQPAAKVGP